MVHNNEDQNGQNEQNESINNESISMEEVADAALDDVRPGSVLEGEIVTIDSDYAYVNVGSKSDGRIPLGEFDDEPAVGQSVPVIIRSPRLTDGVYECSTREARRAMQWEKFLEQYDPEEGIIYGKVVSATPKGKLVDCGGVTGFLPFSLAADLKGADSSDERAFHVKSIDRKRRSLLVSRKDYLDEYQQKQWDSFLEKYSEGDRVTGKVVKFVEFGAFVRVNGIDALLHRNDMTWRKVFKQRKLLKLNEEREFVILSINREERKVSLGLKQMREDPWISAPDRYHPGDRVSGVVVTLTNFGAFVELEEGIEGFLSNNELSWTRKNVSVNDILKKGDTVELEILEVDFDERKINLSRRLLMDNPWDSIEERYPVDSVHKRPIKKIVKFGMFVELEEGIDGLIHVSDISWDDRFDFSRHYSVGDEVEFKILSVSPEEQKISCGMKQLQKSPWETIREKYPPRTRVEGTVSGITPFGIFLKLEEDIEGLVHISEVSRKHIENLEDHFSPGDRVNALVLGVDVEKKRLSLSIKGFDMISEKEELDRILKKNSPSTVTLGDMINIDLKDEEKKDSGDS